MSADKFLADNWDKGWPVDTWTTVDVIKFADLYANWQHSHRGTMMTKRTLSQLVQMIEAIGIIARSTTPSSAEKNLNQIANMCTHAVSEFKQKDSM